jgi:predicted SAM-dependent methyltransferase
MKLNLGCGTNNKGEGWTNIDLYSPLAHIRHDLTNPLPFADETVDQIFSSHLIEHFTREEWELVRKDWLRVLKPGGTLEIHCPNFIGCITGYLATREDIWLERIYGAQTDRGQFHKNGFDMQKVIKEFEPHKVEFLEPASDYDLHFLITK